MKMFEAESRYPVQIIFGISLAICIVGLFLSQLAAFTGFPVLRLMFLLISISGSLAVTVISILIMIAEAIDLFRKSRLTIR